MRETIEQMLINQVGEMIERLEAHMGRADLQDVLADCRAAASMLRRLAASDTEAMRLLREAREDMAMCVAEMARARGRLETTATCNEDRRIAASLGSTCDHLRSRWFSEETRIDAALAKGGAA